MQQGTRVVVEAAPAVLLLIEAEAALAVVLVARLVSRLLHSMSMVHQATTLRVLAEVVAEGESLGVGVVTEQASVSLIVMMLVEGVTRQRSVMVAVVVTGALKEKRSRNWLKS